METNNELTLIGEAGLNKHKQRLCLFKCSCGNEVVLPYHNFHSGNTKSCGHLNNKYKKMLEQIEELKKQINPTN